MSPFFLVNNFLVSLCKSLFSVVNLFPPETKNAKVELYPINETPHAGNPKGVNESMPSPIPSPKAMFVVILFLFYF